LKNFDEIIKCSQEYAKDSGPQKIAVAFAQNKDVLKAIKAAVNEKICVPVLIGDRKKIVSISEEIDFDIDNFEIIDEKDGTKACKKAVSLVSRGKADILMKGLIDTSIILKAVLNKEIGLRTGNVLSHAAVFSVGTYHKIFVVTDAAMNIAPNADGKRQIIENAIKLSKSLGANVPKVAVICAKEKVDPKMQSTLDAQELVRMRAEGRMAGCIVEGPYALDNAMSKEAAELKGVKGEAAGDADILLMPNIEAGNVFYKSLTYLANADNAGIILGAKAPIVLTSRADSEKAKLNSIALAVLLSSYKGE
jgi:phosphate butyryltransferase